MRTLFCSLLRTLAAVGLLQVLIGGGPAAWPAGARHYRIEDLGTLGGAESYAAGINDRGQVAGSAKAANGQFHAFRWTPAIGMEDLGALGGLTSLADGINAAGQVSGLATTATGLPHAFRWTAGAGMRDLGTLRGAFSSGRSINDRGEVAGSSDTGRGQFHAFRWSESAGMKDLGTPDTTSSDATGINNAGQVAGSVVGPNGLFQAFRWTEGTGLRGLGSLGGEQSLATGINASGQVVGIAYTRAGTYHAFRWTEGAGMLDLGTLGGLYSYALGINARGQVVGWADRKGGFDGPGGAFLDDDDEGMVNLNTRIDPARGWVLNEAHAINNPGQIAGTGSHNGQTRAFLLTPAPPDTTPPSTSASLSPAPLVSGWNNTDVTVSLTAADDPDGWGVKEILYRLRDISESANGVEVRQGVFSGSSSSLAVTDEGTFVLTYFARDNAGNQENAQTLFIRIDKTPPTISFTGDGDYTDDQRVEITCSATDDRSGVASRICPDIRGPAASFGLGTHHVVAVAHDRAGNVAIASTTFTVRSSEQR